MSRSAAAWLQCPGCAARYRDEDRFCAECGMPLVLTEADPRHHDAPRRRQWAQKVKPQLAEGELVRVAGARNLTEAEFIQALLLEEGVPSMLRRSAGFDVPDFLAAGPRDILVAQSGVRVAREVLLQANIVEPAEPGRIVSPARLLAGILLVLAAGVLVAWALIALL